MTNTEIVSDLSKIKDEVVCMDLQVNSMSTEEYRKRVKRVKDGIKSLIEKLGGTKDANKASN